MDKQLTVGIGDMKLTREKGVLITYALGSCIGISFYDPFIRLGALLHIMLPARTNPQDARIFKYADTGIHETVRKLTAFGMVKNRTIVKIAGGAKMFELKGSADFGNIGQRNAAMVRQILKEEHLQIKAEDTGGSFARTMLLNVEDGTVMIRTAGRQEKKL